MSQLQLVEKKATELNCKILAVDMEAQIVLCSRTDANPKSEYVTWAFNAEDTKAEFFWGHYIVAESSVEARDDYDSRVETCLSNIRDAL